MATIIVEDGSIVTGSNSYVSGAELTTFAADRNITLTGDENDLLIEAMDYIESLNFKGYKLTKAQPLQWPRTNVKVDGYYIDTDEIPQELKNGLMQTAIAIDQGVSPLQDTPRAVKKEKVGELEVEYMDNAATVAMNKKIMASLNKLLQAGSMYNGKVSRG